MNTATKLPNPGSPEAIDAGCRCPLWDNHRGKGYLGGTFDKDGNVIFVINESCPLHGLRKEVRS